MPEYLARRATAADSDFRSLIDIAPVMIWVANLDGSCTFLSRSWTTFTGQVLADGLGEGWLTLIHAEDQPGVVNSFVRAREYGQPYQTEYRVRTKDGEYRWVLDSASPIKGPSGALQGYIGSIVDNQSRKAAELARDRSDRRLNIALQASGIGIWEWNVAHNQFEFSQRARGIFGFTEGDVTFERLKQVIVPADLPEVLRLSAAALDPKVRSKETYRYRIVRETDAELRWIEAHGEALFATTNGEDRAETYIGTFEDITVEEERDRTLKEESVRLALALDAAQLAVWELDILNDRIAPSPMLNVLYGFAPDATPTVEELRSRYAPGERERLEELGRQAAERGDDRIRVEVKHVMPDGSIKWLLIQAQTAAPTPEGGPRAIGVVMDVTERKLHEEKLAVAAREMQHRIKNSLALVQSLVQQSFRRDRSVDEGKEAFNSRLRAYVGVTELLSGERKGEATLSQLLGQALAPFRETTASSFVLDGPDVTLSERAAFGLGLAIHELATNATKYGSLSVDEGLVSITWAVAAHQLHLVWRESGGPPLLEPTSRGLGQNCCRAQSCKVARAVRSLSSIPMASPSRSRCRSASGRKSSLQKRRRLALAIFHLVRHASDDDAPFVLDLELAAHGFIRQRYSTLRCKGRFFQSRVKRVELDAVDIHLTCSIVGPMIKKEPGHLDCLRCNFSRTRKERCQFRRSAF
ncbi:PAS domain-containing protein [Devosia aurantiaca]|uniref:Blue-light-activated histidine kinase n=1 Tax=Devosia aurantiaca TaxID=2714858 RepID=A0A6M1SYQ8_9HYPH|nr:PAS domain-containing protein [Devosia aurantiaca]NGP17821.1 PAS domain-containing protein [Devosia aurantiaca]